jgi:apolipoprotein N-acyltransferase
MGTHWNRERLGQSFALYLDLSRKTAAAAPAPDLIVWPESAVTIHYDREPDYQRRFARVLQGIGADVILGGPHHDLTDPANPRYFNSAYYVTADGVPRSRYDKVRLLPFAEYFPLKAIEFLRRRFERVRVFTPADEAHLLQTRFGPVATVICFEGIYPHLVRNLMAQGAKLFVNLSNDAWLEADTGMEQHLAMVTVRAIENRTWAIRATPNGISAVVDPYGRVVIRGEPHTLAALRAEVVPMDVDTVYKRYGDVFAYACLGLCIAVFARRSAQRS